jgi:hypothetical protein
MTGPCHGIIKVFTVLGCCIMWSRCMVLWELSLIIRFNGVGDTSSVLWSGNMDNDEERRASFVSL